MVMRGIQTRSDWSLQVSAKGTVGTNLDVTAIGEKRGFEFLVSAPLADDDATLKIYSDSISAATLLFDGYLANRDSEGRIIIPDGAFCSTKFIVLVAGGSGDVFALVRMA